ncbi:MAG: DnaJ-like cysteine-rich domain-containing protein [Planctomycetota bacterium]|jgi:hypothetical protein
MSSTPLHKRFTPFFLGLALAALAVSIAPRTADADVIRFRNGVVLHGEVIESDQQWFKFRRYDTGGVVTLSWDQIIEEDRALLRDHLGLEFNEKEEGPKVRGLRLYLKSGETVEGLLDGDRTTEGEIWLTTTAGAFPYKTPMIERKEEVDLDVLSVYSREQAYTVEVQRRTDAGEPVDGAEGHNSLGEYCMSIGYYDKAKEHFESVQSADAGYQTEAIKNTLERLELLIRDQDALNLYQEVEKLIANKKFTEAEAKWKELQDQHPEAVVVEENADKIEDRIEEQRNKYLESQVKPRFFNALRLVVNKRSREKYDVVDGIKEEFTLKAAKTWARKEAGKEAAAIVAEQLQITADEVKDVFARRRSFDFRRATYGDGTFIVEKANVSLPKSGSSSQLAKLLKGRGVNPGALNKLLGGQQNAKKNLKTPDDWWKKASTSKRSQWMTAYYAENGGDMEIVRIDTRNCSTCGGKGYLTFMTPGAEVGGMKYRHCPRCHGLGHDRTAVYR